MAYLNMVLCLIFQAADGPVVGICMEKMLTGNPATSSRKGRMFYWSIVFLMLILIREIIPDNRTTMVTNVVYFVVSYFMIRRCYTEKMFLKYAAFLLLQILLVLVDAVYTFFFFSQYGMDMQIDFTHPGLVFGSMIGTLGGAMLQLLACSLWRRRQGKTSLMVHPVFLLTFMLVIIVLFGFGITQFRDPAGQFFHGNYLIVYGCIYFTACIGIFLFINQAERNEIEKELLELQRLSELERVHYAGIEARREELAKLRHDYNNILSTVRLLLHGGKVQEAEQMLVELFERVEATREYPFCDIPIINAILTEKKEICEEKGIALSTKLQLPNELPVSNLDLCIGLGNLMDNAIRACGKAADTKVPEIDLSCGMAQGYLVVRCTNSAQPPNPGKPENTGYGLKILKDLARRYQGLFVTEYQNGVFSAQLNLLVAPAELPKSSV